MRFGAFLGVGAAPDCSSFSRAITPAVRDRDHPEGLPGITQSMHLKVLRGNQHAAFTLSVLKECRAQSLPYWLENPDGSFLWLQPQWIAAGFALPDRCFRFDMCIFHTPWRKRTRVVTSTDLAGIRELCRGGHKHQVLRGRSSAHRDNWTHVAQVYPRPLCARIASAMLRAVINGGVDGQLDSAGCARTGTLRVGEAQNPGPRRARDIAALDEAKLITPATALLQDRAWEQFRGWLIANLSAEAFSQVFTCPALTVQLLRAFGRVMFERGESLHMFRQLLASAQKKFALIRPLMTPAWTLVSQWEETEPLVHWRFLNLCCVQW